MFKKLKKNTYNFTNYGISFENLGDYEKNLRENYTKPGHPIAYSGVQSIFEYYKGGLPIPKIKEILSGIENYTLHREYHKGVRNPSYSHFKRYQWQMDLVDIQALAQYNDGIRYIFTVIDTFTRYAFCRLLKDKTGPTVLSNFKSILNDAQSKPLTLLIDGGSEFRNKNFENFCQEQGIKLYSPDTSTHGAFIERFNRTLQTLIYKFMTENETHRFIDKFQELVKTYNNRKHRMIGITPAQAEMDHTTHLDINIKQSKYHQTIPVKKVIFNIGDRVRISKIKGKFGRGYNEQSNQEIFKIYRISTKKPIPLYFLESYDGNEKIRGGFYGFELTKVSGDVFRIEKILRRRQRNGETEIFVKWKGFNDTYNSWIKENAIVKTFKD